MRRDLKNRTVMDRNDMLYGGFYSADDFSREMIRRREETMGDPLRRRQAVRIDSMLEYYLRDSGLMYQWNCNRIYMAWDKCSGVAKYTLSKSFSSGVLYCGISSSVVRNNLYFQRDIIRKEINLALAADSKFWMKPEDGEFVKSIVLK